jgi:D-alanyl-D-alanine carboxypeptidase
MERPDARVADRAAVAALKVLEETGGFGAAIALAFDGNLLFSSGVGWLDWKRTISFPSGGSSYLWSVTKTLYAVLALQTVERTLVGLDDPANQYVPELELNPGVTIRRLLNHTAGLPDYGDSAEYLVAVRSAPNKPWSPVEFLTRTIQPGRQIFEPGAGWAYSNIGYLILRQILERVNGQPMASILRSSIFAPLGLTRIRFADARKDDLFPGWSRQFNFETEPSNVLLSYDPGWVSHGTVVGPADELAIIFEGIFGGKLLVPSSLEAMLEPAMTPGDHWLFKEGGYGLGLIIGGDPRFGIIAGHGGEGPGYSTAALHFSSVGGHQMTTVALANADGFDLGLKIAYAIAASVADRS